MPFLLAEILNFQGSTHQYGVGSFSDLNVIYGAGKHITDKCMIIFSKEIHTYLVSHYKCEIIGEIGACNGNISIYCLDYKGEKIAFYLTGIGSAVASSMCYERVYERKNLDCQHFFRQIFLGYFSDIVQAFDTLRTNVCGDDYTSLHNPIVLSSVLPAYGMFHSIQILFL